jgi:hypothetical protein
VPGVKVDVDRPPALPADGAPGGTATQVGFGSPKQVAPGHSAKLAPSRSPKFAVNPFVPDMSLVAERIPSRVTSTMKVAADTPGSICTTTSKVVVPPTSIVVGPVATKVTVLALVSDAIQPDPRAAAVTIANILRIAL